MSIKSPTQAPRVPRSWGLAAVLLLSCLLLGACGPRKHHYDPRKPPVIGFSLDSLVVERWRRDKEVFTKAAKDLGAELIFRVADQDPVVQEGQVRDLLNQGIDVLVIVPNDADRLSGVVAQAKARGIPVLSYDRLVRKAGGDLYVSFDSEMVGSLMAQAIHKAQPRGSYIVINGAKSDNNASMINTGIHKVLDPAALAGRIRILAEIWPLTWDSEEVKRSLEASLAVNRQVDGIIAGNDMLAEAAINVLTENGLITQVRVAGQDAELAACQRIVEGTQYATIYKPIDRLAFTAAGFAVMLAKGERIETTRTIDDGQHKVPFVSLEPILVTRETLDSTVIKDGFHARADVYRNVATR